ncbi:hypothetical protein [Salisediminibacterium beveridgei]|uniref:Uncharacterized protein n=1 Tax=Salisediminibacterium beveridgei TaxID=632773 RepID=A0A1D7QVB7_9BACI|nr:hypothetical protein [Salisediminibacterium beveridgei]AOM82955.1 hypothetical protein BBEV_1594 [Salisediminibacterium beveridgei]
MTERMIALHDLHAGFKTKFDIQDHYGRCIIAKNRTITEEDMRNLTAMGTSYFIYQNVVDENDEPEPEATLALVRFLEDISSYSRFQLDHILQGTSLEEDLYIFHEEIFKGVKERRGIIVEKVTSVFFQHFHDGLFDMHLFYWKVKEFLEDYSKEASSRFQEVFVPFPNGAVVSLEKGLDCIVLEQDPSDPENPLLKPILSEDEPAFYLKDYNWKVVSSEPISCTLTFEDQDEN